MIALCPFIEEEYKLFKLKLSFL